MRTWMLTGLAGVSLLSLAGCPTTTAPDTNDNVTVAQPDVSTQAADLVRDTDVFPYGPALRVRTAQQDIEAGLLKLHEIRRRGLEMFSTPFNKEDGFGDGPMDPLDPISPGGRPTLQGNGTFLRVNGLDSQSCLECHAVVSNATIPATFGVGGVGGSAANAISMPFVIDITDQDNAGMVTFNGRFINPPFLFGSGGVELLAKELTAELQNFDKLARANPEQWVRLYTTKGVDFGQIRYVDEEMDTSRLEGIDADLVVKPFGRKGEFISVRAFAVGAMMFHFGMEPIEVVGADVDADGDGVRNEVLIGELSALHTFGVSLDRPIKFTNDSAATRGQDLFAMVGCADCHIPMLRTDRTSLPLTYPEIPESPFANEYYNLDLTTQRPGFDADPRGGLQVPMFSDLKRHDMGPELAESTGGELDPFFITARLWGIADTAPYMHDGRAPTLHEAILLHGGEGQKARDAYADLTQGEQNDILAYLFTLRTPLDPAADLME